MPHPIKPAFVVRDTKTGHEYRVYADGKIEGFPPTATIIINRIPLLMYGEEPRYHDVATP